VAILDDHQDAVRKLSCAPLLEPFQAKVYTHNVKGVGHLSIRLRDADVLVLIHERTQVPRALLEKLPRLKMIAQVGEVGPHLDVQACRELGIGVCQSGCSPVATAELTWMLVLSAMRRAPQYINHLKHGVWQQSGLRTAAFPSNFGLGQVLEGKTLGIWGYGQVGRRVARYAQAFGMGVLVWGSEASRSQALCDALDCCRSAQELFEMADVVSLHLRLSERTRAVVRHEHLSAMKPQALLVNTAHPDLIEEEALLRALAEGHPGMAALDVFHHEPVLQGCPVLRLENTVCTPHIGDLTQESYENEFRRCFEQVAAFVKGQAQPWVVRPSCEAPG
jgi:D-3-phosphoglycerate dehydrogenase